MSDKIELTMDNDELALVTVNEWESVSSTRLTCQTKAKLQICIIQALEQARQEQIEKDANKIIEIFTLNPGLARRLANEIRNQSNGGDV